MPDNPDNVDEFIDSIRDEIEASGGTITAGGDRYAVVGADGIVSNTIMWNPDNAYNPGDDNTLLYLGNDSQIGIGDKVDASGNILVKYEPPAPVVQDTEVTE